MYDDDDYHNDVYDDDDYDFERWWCWWWWNIMALLLGICYKILVFKKIKNKCGVNVGLMMIMMMYIAAVS